MVFWGTTYAGTSQDVGGDDELHLFGTLGQEHAGGLAHCCRVVSNAIRGE